MECARPRYVAGRPAARSYQGGRVFLRHITSKGLKPLQQVGVGLPRCFAMHSLIFGGRWYAFFQGGLFGPDGDLGVSIRSFEAGMPQPGTNNVDLDT
jgi:hypothetical protein